MRIAFPMLLLVAMFSAWSQSSQQKYLESKALFNQAYYSRSIESFASLANDLTFGSYATFYLGLSYHKNGNNQKGLDAWRQLLVRYPKFSQAEEVHFWIAHVLFDRGDFDQAIRQAQNIQKGSIREYLYHEGLFKQPFQLLKQLQRKYKKDSELIKITLKRALTMYLSGDNMQYINALKTRLSINPETLRDYDDVRKDAYTAAIFLPFLFDNFGNVDRIMRNSLVMDLYQGMMLASSMLDSSAIHLNLLPFDTRGELKQTESLLKNEGLSEVDLIIGPLFPKPIKAVNVFSLTNKINLINPISSNSKSVAKNPHAFQMKPSYKTMARKAAKFVAANAAKTESMIYFENKGSEKILAVEYQRAIQELGFEVTNFQPIDRKSAREVLDWFSHQEENVLNITDEEALELIEEGRLIRNRQTFDASGNLITKDDGTTPKLEYYELNFTFDTDSLDHIFVVTRSNLLTNNFVGAVTSIPNAVRLIGLGEWLDFSMLDYHQLERLNVQLIHSQYFDHSSDFFNEVQELCIRRYKTKLSIYHMLGFESVWWSGQMMHRYGKYFQNGFYEEQDFPTLFYGHKYGVGMNDNQIVPIVQFTNSKLRAINLENKSKEE